MNSWILVFAGLLVLVLGAELLVRGASSLAMRLGVSPLVIGLTIVAFGTSSPEVAVSLSAVAKGQSDIALGNVVGSNIFNVLFILGFSALIRPLVVHQRLIRAEVPLMIGTSLLLWFLLLDGSIDRTDGMILLLGITLYTVLAIRSARREPPEVHEEYSKSVVTVRRADLFKAVLYIAGGLALAVFGARWLVTGAVSIASGFGVSELLIGLTIVAAGTSLPEVATSLVAALRGQRDIAVGNVIGSNLFNLLGIVGISGVVAPNGIFASPALLAFDLPVMIAAAVVCLPIAFTGSEIRRWEGAVLLAGYCSYILYLVLDARGHDALEGFSIIMLWFVLPLVTLGLAASVTHAMGRSKRINLKDN